MSWKKYILLISNNSTKWRHPKSKYVASWNITGNKTNKAAAATRKMCKVENEGDCNDSVIGHINTEDFLRLGRLYGMLRIAVKLWIGIHISTQEDERFVLEMVLYKITPKLVKCYICCQFVSRKLIAQFQRLVGYWRQLLINPMDGRLINRIVNVREIWPASVILTPEKSESTLISML